MVSMEARAGQTQDGRGSEHKYGQIAGNRSINAAIYTCLELIDEKDRPEVSEGVQGSAP